jgi:hypothetical protein
VKDSIGRQPWQLLRISGAAARRDEEGMYPLHITCRKKASLNLLKLLLDAYPECILKMDDYGKTPTQLLTDSGVAAQRDMNEMLLLHHVCSDFCNEDPCYNLKLFLKLILDAYPKGKNVLDKDNMSPLHHACARANSEEALHLLVTSLVTNDCEPSINAKDRFGRTPLCILMSRTDPAQVNFKTKSLAEIVEVIVSSKVIEHLVNMGANIYLGDAEKNQVSKMFLCTLLFILLFIYQCSQSHLMSILLPPLMESHLLFLMQKNCLIKNMKMFHNAYSYFFNCNLSQMPNFTACSMCFLHMSKKKPLYTAMFRKRCKKQ